LAPKEANVDFLIIALRIIHIFSGVFWVGSSVTLAFFVTPAVAATADAGQAFIAHLITRARIATSIAASAILTVLAGGSLYWIDSQGLTSAWTTSGPGVGFGLGAVFALVGLVFGLLVGTGTTALGRIAAELKGAKPTPGQMTRIQAARRQLAYAGPISTVAMLLALLCMATARYWRL
jgi:uncharacterized membrane protein